ncbi:RagB/SusD family nutrient uptake outer membrane protein [Chitinophaga pinensis]|uniref:SusD-like N-terminal domain-containing protein n=1 Tax=Chitinophaga pinensis TaxID=79329 RepID=A0A5C6M171_9BACT|nr:RagB/SusD family nutrient uptake outer membrane protein [Chitinophaga pinensis]TWW02537.1 hypothetical protein FEF09_01645 [Chitinophaga pinensis]
MPDLVVKVWDATGWDVAHPRGGEAGEAKVQLFASKKDYLEAKPAYTATTGESGSAVFMDVTPGKYFILAFKGEMTNIWNDGTGHTMVSDTLFQSETEIKNPQTPLQSGAMPGDFRFSDLNGDMMISADDVAEIPFLTYDIKKDGDARAEVIIGYKSNSKSTLYTTTDQAQSALYTVISRVGTVHTALTMLDGVLSDDADCNFVNDLCPYDKFTFNPNTAASAYIWTSYIDNILELNKILSSLQQISGDNSAMIAQARVYRAFINLELHTYFGQLPILKNSKMGVDVKRASWEETRAFIKAELNAVLPTLPAIAPASTTGYITSYAAHMLLARLAFQESDIESILSHTDAVINSKAYELVDYSTVFTTPATHEIILNIPVFGTGESPFINYFVRNNVVYKFLPTIRYTEAWLLRGYGKAMANELADIKTAVNTIRARSKKPALDLKNMDEAIAELGLLYKEELYREGFRYAFLVLTNQAAQVLTDKGYKDHHIHLPIPMSVLEVYPGMIQNAGY